MTKTNDEMSSVAAILAAMEKAAKIFGAAPVENRKCWNEAAGVLSRLEDTLADTRASTGGELAGKMGELAAALEVEDVGEWLCRLARSCADDAAEMARPSGPSAPGSWKHNL